MNTVLQKMLQLSTNELTLKINFLKRHSNLPGAKELNST